jgi:branched-chain amino acid aminotransferase
MKKAMRQALKRIVGIQSNLLEDPFGWRVLVGEGVAEEA